VNSDNIICFYKEGEPYYELSNWKEAPFMYAGMKYSSALQFLMYHKVMLFGQRQLAQKIMQEKDQQEIKKLGLSKFEGFTDMMWDVCSDGIAQRGVLAKFQQNPDLAKVLLDTEGKIIAFSSALDNVWGTGLPASSPKSSDVSKWEGKNKLGKILMQVRETMRFWILTTGNLLPYVDIKEAPTIEEFDLTPGELMQDPMFFRAIQTYVLSLPDSHAKETCLWAEKLGRMDVNILSLPRAGFFEMKQEVYDIARLKHLMLQSMHEKNT